MITVHNAFHGTVTRIRPGTIDARKAKRIKGRLCGIRDCTCSDDLGTVPGAIHPTVTGGHIDRIGQKSWVAHMA